MDNNNAWLADRIGWFTASEIHKLMKTGRSKDKYFGDTALSYINEKIAECITGERKADFEMAAMAWGRQYEKDAILFFEKQYGLKVDYYGAENPKYFPFNNISGGSPDGEIITEDALCEAKCPFVSANHISYLLALNHANINQWIKDEHIEYYTQMQFNMMAATKYLKRDIKKCYFLSYDPRTVDHEYRLAVMIIVADAEYQSLIEERTGKASEIVTNSINLLNDYKKQFLLAI